MTLHRPWCCVEPRCAPLHQIRNWRLDEPRPGESFVCFGRMPQDIEFEYDGAKHQNDLRSCHYTPLKGLVAWQENEDDWSMAAGAYRDALHKARGECPRCYGIGIQYLDAAGSCEDCEACDGTGKWEDRALEARGEGE